MADDTEAGHHNIVSQIQREATELSDEVQSLDRKIEDLRMLENFNDAGDHHEDFDPVATIEAIQRGLAALQSRLQWMLLNLSLGGYRADVEVAFLQNKFKEFKREERSLNFRFNKLAKRFKKPNPSTNLEPQGRQESTSGRQKGKEKDGAGSGLPEDAADSMMTTFREVSSKLGTKLN